MRLDVLLNTPAIEVWPGGLLHARSNRDARLLARATQVLRRKRDDLFGETCQFLNQETRGCGIYNARPAVCREYPITTRCAYYDLYKFEKEQQDDPNTLPVVQITFRNGKKK